jgi:hypothetical protein
MDRLRLAAATGASFALGITATLTYQRLAEPTSTEFTGPSSPSIVAASGVTAAPRPVGPAVARAPVSPLASSVTLSKSSTPAARALANGSPPIPITVGFEHEFATEDGADADLNPVPARHAKLQAEARDPDWADSTEQGIKNTLQDFLDENGIDRHDVELTVVRCGTTMCEIQVVGQADGATHDWQMVLPQLLQGSLGQDFKLRLTTTMVFGLPDGHDGFVTYLTRKVNQQKVGPPRRV